MAQLIPRLIAAELAKAGLVSTQKQKPLTKNRVEEVLQNPFYFGEMKIRNRRVPHIYEPIVERWLWDKCQGVTATSRSNRKVTLERELLFKGLVKCANCGYSITVDIKKGKYVYLKCTQYGGSCGALRVKEEELLPQVAEMLERLVIPTDQVTAVITEMKRRNRVELERNRRNYDVLRLEHDTIADQLKVMYEDRLVGRISHLEYDQLVSAKKARQVDLNTMMSTGDHVEGDLLLKASSILALASQASEIFNSSRVPEQREILQAVVSNLKLDGKKLSITLKAPFDAISECFENDSWLPLAGYFRTYRREEAPLARGFDTLQAGRL